MEKLLKRIILAALNSNECGSKAVSCNARQKGRNYVYLPPHYLTFSEGPRGTFGPVA